MPFIPVQRLLSESPELKNTKKLSRINTDSTRNTVNTSTANPDEEINIVDLIKTELQTQLNTIMPSKIEKGKKGGQKSPETHAETKDMRLDADAMAKIVAEVVSQLTPVLIKAITTAIASCMTSTLTKQITKIEEEQSVQRQYIQQQSLNALYERDKLEQYDRRLNIRINGVEEKEQEVVEELVEQVCAAAKAPIRKEDISACHRIGAKGTTHRAIICRFISRQTQSRVMNNNKNLRGAEGFHNKIFLNEDLTRLRARLFYMVRKSGKVIRASTKNG